VVPESQSVLAASNAGTPVILEQASDAAQAYTDAVARFMGEEKPLRFVNEERGLLRRLFGARA
jgi:septum site-determining protein MinD